MIMKIVDLDAPGFALGHKNVSFLSRPFDLMSNLDNHCVQIYNKNYAARFAKTTYNLLKIIPSLK